MLWTALTTLIIFTTPETVTVLIMSKALDAQTTLTDLTIVLIYKSPSVCKSLYFCDLKSP